MAEVASEIADGTILNLIEKFLKSGVMEEGQLRPTTKGTPQGGVISPLLANIVLNPLDHALEKEGYKFVRYADDFVILCKTEQQAIAALEFARNILEQMGLELSSEKTKIVQAKDGFDFLGFHMTHRHITIRDKSVEKFKEAVRNATIRSRNLEAKVIEKLNQIIRGTVNYFALPITTTIKQFSKIEGWIRSRIRYMKCKCISKTLNWKVKNKYITRLGLLSCTQLCRKRMNAIYVP
jgi:RNA-directed DNA polymerase